MLRFALVRPMKVGESAILSGNDVAISIAFAALASGEESQNGRGSVRL